MIIQFIGWKFSLNTEKLDFSPDKLDYQWKSTLSNNNNLVYHLQKSTNGPQSLLTGFEDEEKKYTNE